MTDTNTRERWSDLEEKAKGATPGPYDRSSTGVIRALRGDLAVPLFEPRIPACDPTLTGPTVRVGSDVVFRAGSRDARFSEASAREEANTNFVVALLNEWPALISHARAVEAENERLRKTLESICSMQAQNCGDGISTHLALIGLCDEARAALTEPRAGEG